MFSSDKCADAKSRENRRSSGAAEEVRTLARTLRSLEHVPHFLVRSWFEKREDQNACVCVCVCECCCGEAESKRRLVEFSEPKPVHAERITISHISPVEVIEYKNL